MHRVDSPARRLAVPLTLAAIVAVYAALYAPARRFEFVWADGEAIRDSRVFDEPLWRALRTTEHGRMDPSLMELQGIVLTHEAYRPLLILTHALDIRLFGRVPGPMHVHSVLLGALGILAAFWLAARLLGNAWAALVVTALFAWHPLHVEPICFLCARGDPLGGLLGLVAAALVVEMAPPGSAARGRGAQIALAVGAGLLLWLSLLAKEAALLLPVAVAALALAVGRVRAWWPGLAALAAAVPLYAITRALAALGPPAAHADRLRRAAWAGPAIVLEYARSFALPFDLSISRALTIPAALGWIVLVAAVAAGVVAWRRAPESWRGPLALAGAGLVWAGACIGPGAVAVFSEATVADRYAYLAVFGFALALCALGRRVAAVSTVARGCVLGGGALLAALFVFVTAREVPHWAQSGLLFAHDVDVHPDSAMAQSRFGRWLAEARDWSGAVDHFERAAALPGAGDRVLVNLGVGYLNVGRLDDAERTLRSAVERSSGSSYRAWYNLGTAERLRGDVPAACASFRRAIALSPAYDKARVDLSRYCPAAR